MSDNNSTPSVSHHRLLLLDVIRDERFRSVALWVAAVLVLGSVFYHYVEGWSWVDSFYFRYISLAAVGYGDFAPTSDISKLFTVLYIANGIGVLIAFFDIFASLRLGRRVSDFE